MESGGARRGQESQTVARALELLSLVAASPEPLTTRKLAEKSGLSRPTTYRLLVTLERQGYLDRVQEHAFTLGYKATRMSGVRASHQALARRARPVLEALMDEVGDTSSLSVPVGSAVVEIEQIDPPHPVRQMSYINMAFPLHCSSNGKVMLSEMTAVELDAYLSRPLEPWTQRSITEPERLRQELSVVRAAGYGTSIAELYDGINGISAALRDESGVTIGFVGVSGPDFRLTERRVQEAANAVLRACQAIRTALKSDVSVQERSP